MLKKGYITSSNVYVSIEHSDSILNGYFEELDPIFKIIRDCEDGRDVESLLDGPVCHDGFARLN